MIDLFGYRAKAELAALRETVSRADALIIAQSARIRELADIIRENDQLIYQMAQKTSWDQQRPLFNELQAGQEARMKAESSRIGGILRSELIEVYGGKLSPKNQRLISK